MIDNMTPTESAIWAAAYGAAFAHDVVDNYKEREQRASTFGKFAVFKSAIDTTDNDHAIEIADAAVKSFRENS